LPDGAQALASTPAGELQAARFTDTVWGVQWHPEIDDGIFGAWAEGDREETERLGVDTDRLLMEVAAARTELVKTWKPLGTSFANLTAAPR
jgi:GMP synthase (glutamine-hydrolysing)